MPFVPAEEAMNLTSIDVEALVAELGPPPWRKPLVGTASCRVVLAAVAPAMSPHPMHHHPRAEEVFYVLRGTGHLTVGDHVEHAVEPGFLMFVPREVPHTITASASEPLVWMSFVAPNEDAPDTEVILAEPSRPGVFTEALEE
jgi:mannose-6-phosphate isomerase-like protein (cupin superfamily)